MRTGQKQAGPRATRPGKQNRSSLDAEAAFLAPADLILSDHAATTIGRVLTLTTVLVLTSRTYVRWQ